MGTSSTAFLPLRGICAGSGSPAFLPLCTRVSSSQAGMQAPCPHPAPPPVQSPPESPCNLCGSAAVRAVLLHSAGQCCIGHTRLLPCLHLPLRRVPRRLKLPGQWRPSGTRWGLQGCVAGAVQGCDAGACSCKGPQGCVAGACSCWSPAGVSCWGLQLLGPCGGELLGPACVTGSPLGCTTPCCRGGWQACLARIPAACLTGCASAHTRY